MGKKKGEKKVKHLCFLRTGVCSSPTGLVGYCFDVCRR
jgi:hypothetical protein